MHTDLLSSKIYSALNKELLRRMLIKYFFDKGFKENMSGKLYPPYIQDLPMLIPQLSGKVEIIPSVEDINPQTGVVTLGWNLFVLGNKRMNLGETSHINLSEISNQIFSPTRAEGIATIQYRTPKKVVSFIIDILAGTRAGDLGRMPIASRTRVMSTNLGVINNQGGYFKNSFVN